ncbi:hypothetical protein OY671_007670, partial [Metschnikowia pulcherrima]
MTTTLAAIADIANGPFNIRPVARPKAGTGEVLIRVHVSGTNPLDT